MAGAAILAGVNFTPAAQAQGASAGSDEEAAYAVPRITPLGSGVALPRPLAPSQAVLVRRAFEAQARGHMDQAARDIAELADPLLLGHLLADRYLGRFHRSTAGELRHWLEHYGSEPDAPAIFRLLERRSPKGAALPDPPAFADALSDSAIAVAPPEEIDQAMRNLPEDGKRQPALAAMNQGIQGHVLFARNEDAEALEVAGKAFRQGEMAGQVGYAGYVAGLAAWRLQRPRLARRYFEDAAYAKLASPAVLAATAFWAARANVLTGHPTAYAPWLRRAARQKRTFYGLLARSILGQDTGLAWQRESLTEADVSALNALPGGRRAFALIQVGQTQRAEAELRLLWAQGEDRLGLPRALLLVAREADMVELVVQLATVLQSADNQPHDDMRFALPHLAPRGGFRIDPPLVYALTRLESNFDADAVSPTGARGLMQVQPVTAGDLIEDLDLSRNRIREHLNDPATNLQLGQAYMLNLSERTYIGHDLIRLLASYNSGPGRFARWAPDVRDHGDPLLFIEAIPNMETRYFVQRVLAYSWIYAARMGKPGPGLRELAAGTYPTLVIRDRQALYSAALH